MASYSYLYMSESEDPDNQDIKDQILAVGRYVVPVFWFSAFATDEVYNTDYELERSPTGNPVIIPLGGIRTTRDRAVQRAINRREVCFSILPDSLQPIYDEWFTLLRGIELPYLHVDIAEIWLMNTDATGSADFLSICTRAFDVGKQDDWNVLLEQAGIEYDPATKQIDMEEFNEEDTLAYRLHGHSWERPVPWKE